MNAAMRRNVLFVESSHMYYYCRRYLFDTLCDMVYFYYATHKTTCEKPTIHMNNLYMNKKMNE